MGGETDGGGEVAGDVGQRLLEQADDEVLGREVERDGSEVRRERVEHDERHGRVRGEPGGERVQPGDKVGERDETTVVDPVARQRD